MKNQAEAKVNVVRDFTNACLASCQKLLNQIEQNKRRLATEFQDTFRAQEELFRLALTEAEALAWQTGYPQLVFPALATEKVQAVAAWQHKQEILSRNYRRLAAVA